MISKKKIANSVLGKIGLRIWRSKFLPFGTEPVFDLTRLMDVDVEAVIFDVGANVGFLANEFYESFPKARIYCFEPFAKTYEELLKNTDKKARIYRNQKACGSVAGKIKVPVRPENFSGLNSLVEKNHRLFVTDQMQDIEIVTIDNFCRQNAIERIDVLKTDTEGFDLDVLRGAEGLLGDRKIQFILSECEFDRVTPEIHTNFFELHAFLKQRGFRLVVNYTEGTSINGIQWASALFGLQS